MTYFLSNRLSTQIGIIFFFSTVLITGALLWDSYREITHNLPLEVERNATQHASFIAASIANEVQYNKFHPLWMQLRKSKQQFHDNDLVRLISFAVTNEQAQVMAHSDAKNHPLMTRLKLSDQVIEWHGYIVTITQPIHHPSSDRVIGSLELTFDASSIGKKITALENKSLITLVLVFLLTVLISLGIRQRVAKPLKDIRMSANRIGSGHAKIDRVKHMPKEIKALAQTISQADQAIASKSREVDRLASVIEQADELIIFTNAEGVIQYVNPAFERTSGFSKDEAIGNTPSIVKSGEHDQSYYARMWSTLQAGKVWKDDFNNRRKDGSIYEVTQTISPILDKNHEIMGFSAVQRDVTQMRRIEEKLHHTDRVESLGVLAGGIAHDFNNLLTAILGNAALALQKLDHTSPAYGNIENVASASHSAADLCRQMLAYSGKGKFIVKPVNLSTLIEGMGKLIAVSIAKNVVMRYQLATPLPMIDADIAQIQQVVLNLMTNAAEAVGDNSGGITLATGAMHVSGDYLYNSIGDENLDEERRYVYLEVSDTGCGMDSATQKKIFDPFFTTKFTGRGLGMSAMLGIVKGHKGALRIYSELGQGTTIRVMFPQSHEQLWAEEDNSATTTINNASGTVLIIDDEETLREVGSAMLEDMGYRVLTAADGIEGLECYRKNKSDIAFVLLDMTMPKMNGADCFRQLRELNPDIKVILSSGYNEQDATSRFIGKGLAGFLQKPYTPNDLAEKISAAKL